MGRHKRIYAEKLASIDQEGDGLISVKELPALISLFSAHAAADEEKVDAEHAAIMKKLDKDGDGKLSKEEIFAGAHVQDPVAQRHKRIYAEKLSSIDQEG